MELVKYGEEGKMRKRKNSLQRSVMKEKSEGRSGVSCGNIEVFLPLFLKL